MKITFLCFFFSFLFIYSNSQDTITVVEKSIKVGIMATETEYYGFAAGDKLIYSYSAEKGKELKDITISEYPGFVKFAEHNIIKIDHKVIEVLKNGIYQFDYYNSNILPRTVNIKIQRIPKSASTKTFNTNIKWINIVDTTYKADLETFELGADTSFEYAYDATVSVPGTVNKENPNKIVIDFIIPASTVKWVYWMGTGEEGRKTFETDQKNFEVGSSRIKGTDNPLAGLAFGETSMSRLPSGQKINYYFISTGEEMQNFKNGAAFKFFKKGDAVTDFALLNYANKNPQKYFCCLRNDNEAGIDVHVKILAVVVAKKYKGVSERVPVYTNRKIPVHEQ